MGSFTCTCGHVTRDGEQTSSLYWIAYSLDEANALESKIAERLLSFVTARESGVGPEWIAEFYGRSEMADEPDSGVIEDVVASEMNHRFRSVFSCPACGRMHVNTTGQDNKWATFKPDGTCGDK